ncbi:hypothetical protein N7468_003251 [Penicillium chermesinum]|uniref:TLC domain-containing protein n=1 Tax=Penicillium chermesinum TaxID=63820 RepID=A0A9W9P8Y2_9EURO|nr:uncharacterized protein N7468_003251 [Penicillium chermesinum]KAJ5238632.1 hypothetical protein N7468_003251 [Penicillium chermesinum]
MAKETTVSLPAPELNAYVSSPSGPRAKETTFREWVVDNQIGISMTIFSMLLALHNLYPSLRPYTQPFFELSYYDAAGDYYVQGWDDVYFVFSVVLALNAVRAIAMDWILYPFARSAGLKRKGCIRFAEQGWQTIYYSGIWALGLYLWKNSYYWWDFSALWDEWPARPLSGLMKWYLLVELGFLIQQIFVIHIEEQRKDHYQMLSHHIITSVLLSSAYVYGFYNVSNVVLCLMDVVDFLLPFAKILKYLGFMNACNVAFGVFMATWVLTRHYLYNVLWWSIYQNVPDRMAYGCYSRATGELISEDGYPRSFGYLFTPFQDLNGPILHEQHDQGLSVVWFRLIARIAYGVVCGNDAEDVRSDEEDEVENDEAAPNAPVLLAAKEGVSVPPIANDVATGPDHRRTNGSGSVRARGRGRGRVPFDQSDRKALLGRIGCDKPT